ncbi:MAG: glycosyltransferase [Candidatus Nanohaloarchaea archaeon]|nr:glycosyltransferase [Candidatus Nanohaloarchaea archaeon]
MDVAVYHPWIRSKGGVERVLMEYADSSRHDIDIYTHYLDDSFEGYENDIEALTDRSTPEGFLRKGFYAFKDIIFSQLPLEDYDALMVSESGIGSLITLRNHSIPTICYCHALLRPAHKLYSYYLHRYSLLGQIPFITAVEVYKKLERRAWSYFDRVVCNSRNTLKNVDDSGLALNKPQRVINPGVNLEKFYSGETGNYFLYPSRFKRYKRQKLAIKAFRKFKQRTGKDFRLVLAGFPDEGEYLSELKLSCVSDDIMIEENLSDLELTELMANCFAVLFTAKNEDWGIVPVEAMASGKPVISVDEGGPKESIKDGETGFLAKANPDALASRMEQLVRDPELYRGMCDKAEEHSKKYSWDRFAEEMDSEVEKLS